VLTKRDLKKREVAEYTFYAVVEKILMNLEEDIR